MPTKSILKDSESGGGGGGSGSLHHTHANVPNDDSQKVKLALYHNIWQLYLVMRDFGTYGNPYSDYNLRIIGCFVFLENVSTPTTTSFPKPQVLCPMSFGSHSQPPVSLFPGAHL